MDEHRDEGVEGLDPCVTHDVVDNILKDPPPPLVGDITFEETPVDLKSSTPIALLMSTRTWSINPPIGWRARWEFSTWGRSTTKS
jgi:hypothetical protein